MAIQNDPTSGADAAQARETVPYPKTYAPASVTETGSIDGARPAEAAYAQYLNLAPRPRSLAILGIGMLAAGIGLVGGALLGRRRSPAAPRPVRRIAARADAAAGLAPLAFRLLQNPVVRAYAIRLITRQISRRLPG